MTWRACIKLLIGFTLLIALVWFSQPQRLRAWAWFTFHHYPANSLTVPQGFEPLFKQHSRQCLGSVLPWAIQSGSRATDK